MEPQAGGQMKVIADESGKFALVSASFPPRGKLKLLKRVRNSHLSVVFLFVFKLQFHLEKSERAKK